MKIPEHLTRLEAFNSWKQKAFILALVQRAWPNFVLFCETSGSEETIDLGRTEEILKKLWLSLVKKDKNSVEAEDDSEWDGQWESDSNYLVDIEAQLEKVDSFGAIAASGVCQLLEQAILSDIDFDKRRGLGCREDSTNLLVQLIQLQAFGTLVEGVVDEDKLVKILDGHLLMKREIQFHKELVHWLDTKAFLSTKALLDLCRIAADGNVSNLGISLDNEGNNESDK